MAILQTHSCSLGCAQPVARHAATFEKQLESTIPSVVKSSDLELNARGKARWKLMVRRARKPMIKEKFIEDGGGKNWIMTDAGRRALEAPVCTDWLKDQNSHTMGNAVMLY